MRILKVTQAYFPFLDRGGPAVKVHALAGGLALRGHRVTVLTADLGLQKLAAPSMAAERQKWGWRVREESGVEGIYLYTRARYRSLTLNPGVLSFCAGSLRGFDLAHIYGLYDLLGPAVGSACRRCGIPYVLEPMGMSLPIIRSLRLKRAYHILLGQRLMRGARRLIATSDQEAMELIAVGIPASQLIVRRNGIAAPPVLPEPGSFRRQWKIPADASLILFLGRLVSKKSPDLLLEAFARWRAGAGQGRACWLVLAGPDERDGYLEKLKETARNLNVSEHVLFTGPLYGDAKWAAYRDADVFVLPSQHENFGNTAGEAIACGTPVIVTDRCGIAAMIEGRAGLVIPHSARPLEAALLRMLGDEAVREHFRSGCAEVARGLSWDEPLSQMENLYAEVVREVAGG
jgi:glycosyltransferase involved in cell wall biosynthesis